MNELREHLKKKFNLTDEQYDALVKEQQEKSTTKIDVNNLGSTVVDLFILIDALEQRVQALEGGSV